MLTTMNRFSRVAQRAARFGRMNSTAASSQKVERAPQVAERRPRMVYKFGGSSVGNAQSFRDVARILDNCHASQQE